MKNLQNVVDGEEFFFERAFLIFKLQWIVILVEDLISKIQKKKKKELARLIQKAKGICICIVLFRYHRSRLPIRHKIQAASSIDKLNLMQHISCPQLHVGSHLPLNKFLASKMSAGTLGARSRLSR